MKLLLYVLLFLVLSMTAVAVYDAGFGGYSGIPARERRADDPYSRKQYFGEHYVVPYANFGRKGPTYAVTNTGAKSGYSSTFQFDTADFTARGRDPGKVSNWDPKFRGYARTDRVVELRSYGVDQLFGGDYKLMQGTARIISQGNAYGAADLNKPNPRMQVFLTIKNTPPLLENQVFEVWLVDEETGYAQTMGIMRNGMGNTAQLLYEMHRTATPFEAVMVTREPFPDIDPRPSEVMLYGVIDPSRKVVPVPTTYFERTR